MDRLFLGYSVERLRQLEGRIQYCLGRLTTDQVWWRGADETNSIGNLILHLNGNVQQWIVASIGGRPDVRERESEFAARGGQKPEELQAILAQTIDQAISVIDAVTPDRLTQTVRVQGYDKSVLEAIYHVVEHFSMHTGQILYVTKLLRNEDLGFYKHLAGPAPREHQETTP